MRATRTAPINKTELHWLLTAIACIVVVHAVHLPLWVTAVSFILGAYRYAIAHYDWPMPKSWQLMPVTFLLSGGVLLNYHTLLGRDASLSLMVVMLSLKLIETKNLRGYLFTVLIGFFLVSNLFLFNQSILTFTVSLPPLLLLIVCLILISSHGSPKPLSMLRLAGKLLLQSLPIMLILFVLFPRIPGPLWQMPQDANSGMTGLGDTIDFGNISKLTKNSSVAFRVQFKGSPPPQHSLYWRGPVLWHKEERVWSASSDAIGLATEKLTVAGQQYDYTITLEPHNRRWLLLLDMPTAAPKLGKLTHDFTAVATDNVRERIRYEATSYSDYTLAAHSLGEREKIMTLQLTEDENPRAIALGHSWLNLSAEDKINAALSRFRQAPYAYTLSPPRLGKDPIDAFLFDTKRGFCEHYATSFVYLMRAAGLPARIVTGYQGGEYNPNGNYYIVRQSDAHAWAEVWLQNKGWVRIDPTAAVAPERIEQGIDEAINERDQLPMMARGDYRLLHKAFLNWDSINNGWNQWVLGYDEKKQLDLLQKVTGKRLSLVEIAMWMGALTMLAAALTTWFIFWQQRAKLSPVGRLYLRYLNKLKKVGITPKEGEGALDLAKRAAEANPAAKQALLAIAECYNQTRYSAHKTVLTTLKTRIQQLKLTKQ